jgi:hypothetical protein
MGARSTHDHDRSWVEVVMSCTGHLLNFTWEHHSWQRRVTSTDDVPSRQTDMWGRVWSDPYVRCHAEYVCTECGATRDDGDCLCDAERGAHCPPRLAYLERMRMRTHAG